MNTKSFAIGFAAMDSIITGIIHAAKYTAHGAQVSAQATTTVALNTSEAVTSFFAGVKHAVKCRRGTCRIPTLDVRSNEE